MIRVLIVDDHELVRGGLRAMIDAQEGIEVVGEEADGEEALRQAAALQPDVVAMDRRARPHPHRGGAEHRLVEPSHAAHGRHRDRSRAAGHEGAGAALFLLKDAPARLAEAVRTVAAGESLLAPAITRRLVKRFCERPAARERARRERFAAPTDREREVLVPLAPAITRPPVVPGGAAGATRPGRTP